MLLLVPSAQSALPAAQASVQAYPSLQAVQAEEFQRSKVFLVWQRLAGVLMFTLAVRMSEIPLPLENLRVGSHPFMRRVASNRKAHGAVAAITRPQHRFTMLLLDATRQTREVEAAGVLEALLQASPNGPRPQEAPPPPQ